METILCENCKELYSGKRKPILLVCGHTICEKCLTKIMYAEKSFFCPFDRIFIKLAQCKTNIRILRIAENSSKKFPDIVNDLKASAKKRKEEPTICRKDLHQKKTIPTSLDDITIQDLSTFSNYLSPPSKGTVKNMRLTPCKSVNYGQLKLTPRNSPDSHPRYLENRRRKKSKRCRSRRVKVKSADYSFTNAVVLAATVLGGVYLFTKFTSNSENPLKQQAKMAYGAIKESSGAMVLRLLNLIN